MTTWISTERIGQLTGSGNAATHHLTDAIGWPLTNDTSRFGVAGVDLGATACHNGRLYFFFGDVIPTQVNDQFVRPRDSDLVAWTDDAVIQHHGGHVGENSWNFFLPNDQGGGSSILGQNDWRFCYKCNCLFWAHNGDVTGSVCPAGGTHAHAGWNFSLPNDHQGGSETTGQSKWRYCAKCHSLFWNDPSAGSRCPAGGAHMAAGWNFFLPNDRQEAGPSVGQGDWRHCATCGTLFWNGYPFKGVCVGARGGGFKLNAVLGDGGYFDPFCVDGDIGILGNGETPVGAFSFNGIMHVFVWVGEKRPAPAAGTYLVRKANPAAPGSYQDATLFSRRWDTKGFWQVSPCVVSNAEHPGLPFPGGHGAVLFGHGWDDDLKSDGVHLAWMPLSHGSFDPVALTATQYYTGDAAEPWSSSSAKAKGLFARPHYTALSAAWLSEPRKWILLYTCAAYDRDPLSTVVARVADTPWGIEHAVEIEIFNPTKEEAFGHYIYRPYTDQIEPFLPPQKAEAGYPYGAFLLNPFTTWDPGNRELGLYYLLSTFTPYQVQLMHTKLHLTSDLPSR